MRQQIKHTCIMSSFKLLLSLFLFAGADAADPAAVCVEASSQLKVDITGDAISGGNGDVYVGKDGLSLTCVTRNHTDTRLNGMRWEFWDSRNRRWGVMPPSTHVIKVLGATLEIGGSTSSTRSWWGKIYSTLYRCVARREKKIFMSDAVSIFVPYFEIKGPGRTMDGPQCCLECSNPGLPKEMMESAGNISWQTINVITFRAHNLSRIQHVTKAKGCLVHADELEYSIELLEISCWLSKTNRLMNLTSDLMIQRQWFTLRSKRHTCSAMPSGGTTLQQYRADERLAAYMECRVSVSGNSSDHRIDGRELHLASLPSSDLNRLQWFVGGQERKAGRPHIPQAVGAKFSFNKTEEDLNIMCCGVVRRQQVCRSVLVSSKSIERIEGTTPYTSLSTTTELNRGEAKNHALESTTAEVEINMEGTNGTTPYAPISVPLELHEGDAKEHAAESEPEIKISLEKTTGTTPYTPINVTLALHGEEAKERSAGLKPGRKTGNVYSTGKMKANHTIALAVGSCVIFATIVIIITVYMKWKRR